MSMFKNEAPKSDEKMLVYARMGRSLLLPVEGSEDQNRRAVTAQPDKGLLYVVLDEMKIPHLRWKNRVTNTIDLDLMIFPDEVVFKKVQENEDGKVFILKYKENREAYPEGGVFAFWLQDEESDKDDDLAERVDRELNFNSKKRLNPNAKLEEPPKKAKPTAEAIPTSDSPVPTESEDPSTSEPLLVEPEHNVAPEPVGEEDAGAEEAASAIADAFSTSICDSAVAEAASEEQEVENENQRGKEKRAARSDLVESPQGPMAKRTRPNDDED